MSTSFLGSTEPHSVESEVKYFDDKFRSLVIKAYQEVNGVNPSDFLACQHIPDISIEPSLRIY